MKTIYFCRHGETHANASNVLQGSGVDMELNNNGREQAKSLRDELKNIPVELIISSKLKRAEQTAKVIKQCHSKAEVVRVAELAETSFGDWEGTKSPHLNELLRKWGNGMHNEKPPNGESLIEVQSRVMPVIYSYILNRKESVLVFVVHGAMMRVILSSLLFRSLDYTHLFSNHNACINILQAHISNEEVATPLNDENNVLQCFAEYSVLTPPNVVGHHPQNLVFVPVKFDYTAHLEYTMKW
ncbi:hypothetical protein HDV01_002913 [Terramyces sp. JEL0728]|nr:hypothetical protein HDV01_002913 [Terramyces sp. JEL0728]